MKLHHHYFRKVNILLILFSVVFFHDLESQNNSGGKKSVELEELTQAVKSYQLMVKDLTDSLEKSKKKIYDMEMHMIDSASHIKVLRESDSQKTEKVSSQGNYIVTAILVSIAIFIGAFVLFAFLRQNRIVNKELQEKNEEISKKKDEIRNKALAIQEKAKELDKKNREMDLKNRELDQKNWELYEKNIEIKDSLYAGKRIQVALITKEAYIEKHLNRLKNKIRKN
jgi:hypothetical protein